MKKEIKTGIYCIENKINNKKYIGQAVDIYARWNKHINELNLGKHHNDYLQKSWDKYGEDNFCFYILECCDENHLDEKEDFYINLYGNLNRDFEYNLKSGGQNGGSKFSKELRMKLSDSIKKSYENTNLREIRSKSALKQWADPEIKKKISGKNNGMYGKKHTDEAIQKIRDSKIGKMSPKRNLTSVFCIELKKRFKDATSAAKELNIDSSAILKVCRGERKTCGGYHWEFIYEENNLS